jgi:hypothetical protein
MLLSLLATLMVSRPVIEGEKLVRKLLEESIDFGGAFAYITGAQGGGKTSATFAFITYTLKKYPLQKVFLSETYDAPLQCFKLGIENCNFLVKEDSNVIFRDVNNGLKEAKGIKVTYFKDFDDLYKKAVRGKCNVVFFGDRTIWMEFLAYLRHTGEWSHVFIDEIGEVIPSNTSGKLHKRIGQFALFSKDIRKCRMKVISNTQSVRDMDWRILDKFMYRIFLPGAMADIRHSRIVQRAIDNLEGSEEQGNHAFIDKSGKFGLILFTDIFKPDHRYVIEAHIKGQSEYHVIIPEETEAQQDVTK